MDKLLQTDFVNWQCFNGSKEVFFVALLAYIYMGFVVIDSFINMLPNGGSSGTVTCFVITSSSISGGQQDYINDYCSNQVPAWASGLSFGVFGLGVVTLVLHYAWYAAIKYSEAENLEAKKAASEGKDLSS